MSSLKKEKIISDIEGLIVLNKPKGYTSNDCIAVIKRGLHPKKIGHTGTLDVNATGVLVCLLGNATKCQELLMKKGTKIYEAELIIGVSTDTEDATGKILNVDTIDNIDSIRNKINESIKSFIGTYDQVPPMYSAKKVAGKKLIDMVRKGVVIDRKACKVSIDDISILDERHEKVTIDERAIDVYKYKLRITCSKGTYIRTLCKDIGEKIGLASCMGDLIRVKNGDFNIEDSISLDDVKMRIDSGDYSFIKPCYYLDKETAVTFGKFDTLHIGHKLIIETLVEEAKRSNLVSVAMIVGDNGDNEILSHDQRISKLKYLEIDKIVNYKLTDSNKMLSPISFIHDILYKQLKAKIIVVGSDCHFGYKGEGDANLLKNECEKLGIKVLVMDKLKVDGTDIDISSTYIKDEYSKGNTDLVSKLIGKDKGL